MIKYNAGGCNFITNICRVHGSVFPKAVSVAGPAAVVCVLIVNFQGEGQLFDFVAPEDSITKDNAVWSGFSFLVGFLIVFRTSQSYNRFWDGCTSTHQMRAEWFDGCSSLLAFCRHSKVAEHHVLSFQNILVRLFSMLHSAALAEIEDSSSPDIEDVISFQFSLVDVEGIDYASLKAIKHSEAKVELIFQWIQQLIVENINIGVLSIPPPILSRSFQEIANGMVAFHDAMKISQIPFPFPYAQTCDFLLWLHWLVVPFVVSQWCKEPVWAFVFSFIQVFILWVLNFIAVELENPFGCDANDIDGAEMQAEMNQLLLLLLSPACRRTPQLQPNSHDLTHVFVDRSSGLPRSRPSGKSFYQVWHDIDELEGVEESPPRHRISVAQFHDAEASRSRISRPSLASWPSWRADSARWSKGTSLRSMATSSHLNREQSYTTASTTSRKLSRSQSALSRAQSGLSESQRRPITAISEDTQLSSTTSELLAPPATQAMREINESMPDEPRTPALPRVLVETRRFPTHGTPSDSQWRDAEVNALPGAGSNMFSSGQSLGTLNASTSSALHKALPRDPGPVHEASATSHDALYSEKVSLHSSGESILGSAVSASPSISGRRIKFEGEIE